MTTSRYQHGCVSRSQVDGIAPRAFWQVNGNNGNVNYDNRDNNGFVRPCRLVAPGECRGEVPLREIYDAWLAARRRKHPSANQLAFDVRWMDGLLDLQERLTDGAWHPRQTSCFIAQRPKAREIHAPDFSDRVVHHWLVPKLEAIYEPTFIHDSYSNRKGKGTHAAVQRLQQFVRQVHSGQGGGWYLQLDIANFFPSIHRPTLWAMLKERMFRSDLPSQVMLATHALLRQSITAQGIVYRCSEADRRRVPPHKRLENAAPGCGLPIGNLSSQFFANVYLDALDQFVKHTLKAKRYLRYVDDFVLVHRDRAVLELWQAQIEQFLADRLQLRLKADIRLRPLSAGIDFLGYVTFPTHTRVRRRALGHMHERLHAWHREHAIHEGFWASPRDVGRLQSVLASFDGHLQHANAIRIRERVLAAHPWIRRFSSPMRFHPDLEGRRMAFRYQHTTSHLE